ncbi:MAG TPA: M15 family metallopeptidase [Ilumatobacteraceae bacterium]|jgi:hypothetical protein
MVAALVAVAVLSAAVPGSAAAPEVIESAASGGAPAQNVTPLGDLVSVYNFGPLQPAVTAGAQAAAEDAGGWGVPTRGFGTGLLRVSRGGAVVKQAPGPFGAWYYPVSITAMPLDSIGAILGRGVSSPIAAGTIVMSETSAGLFSAQAGDVVDLEAADGSIVQAIVGRVAPDGEIGGAEVVMSTAQADLLGATLDTSVVIYGQFTRGQLESALAARGLSTDPNIRVRRSWDPLDPDSTIGLARTKKALGMFSFHVAANDAVTVDDAWRASYVPSRDLYPAGVSAVCNQNIKADLSAALQEVVDYGLAGHIDLANTNTYGGCFGPRFTRLVGSQLGTLSRHSWAQAIDMNTVANCQGCVPKMDCRIVRIFRKHGFAWGGNFLKSDGMHFEWVGEPRNTYQYPSRYCPNVPGGGIESVGTAYGGTAPLTGNSRNVMFADDGGSLAGE